MLRWIRTTLGGGGEYYIFFGQIFCLYMESLLVAIIISDIRYIGNSIRLCAAFGFMGLHLPYPPSPSPLELH